MLLVLGKDRKRHIGNLQNIRPISRYIVLVPESGDYMFEQFVGCRVEKLYSSLT